MREAVEAACSRPGSIRAHFQPVVDLTRGVAAGYEALARFSGPPQQSPDRWFAAAREAGLGDVLEARALHSALEGRAALPPNCFLTVNLGPDAILADSVRRVLRREGDLRGLVIEVTEQAPVEDYDVLLAALAPLREAGALVAVDDAGAGFASLRHITTLRPDFVKVDRDLVAGVDADETKAAVVETLGVFASRIDAWIVAEGIETDAELERLISLGVPLGQGYRLGRPSPAMAAVGRDVTELCRRRADAAQRSELLRIVETGVTARATASDAALCELFLCRPGTEWIVTLDEHDRATAIVRRGGRTRLAPLVADVPDALPDVARRAATRPPGERQLPIALCDEIGRHVGIVTVERLLAALADLVDGASGADADSDAADRPAARG